MESQESGAVVRDAANTVGRARWQGVARRTSETDGQGSRDGKMERRQASDAEGGNGEDRGD